MSEALSERNIAFCQLVSEALRLSGSIRIRAFGDSMFPTILPGDILVVERQEPRQKLRGNVVLFARNGRLFAHRVVSESSRNGVPFFTTRGDSRRENDAPVSPHELLGCVTSLIRGRRQISPRATLVKKWTSHLVGRSDFLTRCLLWLTCRIRSLREMFECPT